MLELKLRPGVGIERVVVNGHDLTGSVRAVSLVASRDEPHRVRLELDAGTVSGLDLEGAGVEVVEGGGTVETIDAFLASVSPEVLEAEVLDAMGYGGEQSTMTVAIARLRAMLRG